MSWHGKWRPDQPDPFAKPAKPGDVFGCWVIVGPAATDCHYGLRVVAKCCRCGAEREHVLAQLRHARPKTHRGCFGVRCGAVEPCPKIASAAARCVLRERHRGLHRGVGGLGHGYEVCW